MSVTVETTVTIRSSATCPGCGETIRAQFEHPAIVVHTANFDVVEHHMASTRRAVESVFVDDRCKRCRTLEEAGRS
jgi:hypothetical protein